MSTDRHPITTESRGGRFGTDFDDSSIITNISSATIASIDIWHSAHINALRVHYTSQTEAVKHGGTGGVMVEVRLGEGEYITRIEGSTQDKTMHRLLFITNKGTRWGPYGGSYGGDFVWDVRSLAPPDQRGNMGLLYFSGSAGTGKSNAVAHLQATFAKYITTITSFLPSTVRYEERTPEESSANSVPSLSTFGRSLISIIVTLIVGSEKTIFHAHENTLITLPFFRASLLGPFSEASTKTITMADDDPSIIAVLLEFLYFGRYTYTYDPERRPPTTTTAKTPAPHISEGLLHVDVFITASKYDCQPLAKAARGCLLHILTKLEGIEVLQLLQYAYEVGWESEEKDMEWYKSKLPLLLKALYKDQPEEVKKILFKCPALANDLVKMLVEGL